MIAAPTFANEDQSDDLWAELEAMAHQTYTREEFALIIEGILEGMRKRTLPKA